MENFRGSTLQIRTNPGYPPKDKLWKSTSECLHSEQQVPGLQLKGHQHVMSLRCVSGQSRTGVVWVLLQCEWLILWLGWTHSAAGACVGSFLPSHQAFLVELHFNTPCEAIIISNIIPEQLFQNNKEMRKYGIQRVSELGRRHDLRKWRPRKIKSQFPWTPYVHSLGLNM